MHTDPMQLLACRDCWAWRQMPAMHAARHVRHAGWCGSTCATTMCQPSAWAAALLLAASLPYARSIRYRDADQIKKKLKETKSEIEKKMGHGHSAPAATK